MVRNVVGISDIIILSECAGPEQNMSRDGSKKKNVEQFTTHSKMLRKIRWQMGV